MELPDVKAPETATELLVFCLEEFAAVEPARCMVVWEAEDGSLRYASMPSMRTWDRVGMMETAKHAALNEGAG